MPILYKSTSIIPKTQNEIWNVLMNYSDFNETDDRKQFITFQEGLKYNVYIKTKNTNRTILNPFNMDIYAELKFSRQDDNKTQLDFSIHKGYSKIINDYQLLFCSPLLIVGGTTLIWIDEILLGIFAIIGALLIFPIWHRRKKTTETIKNSFVELFKKIN